MDSSLLTQMKASLDNFTNMNCSMDKIANVATHMKVVIYNKDDYFVKANQRSHVICFIQKGLFRIFVTDHNGKEFTKNFLGDGYFMGALTSLYAGQESLTNIQALEECTTLEIAYDTLLSLVEQSPTGQKLLRIAAEKKYLEKELRETELLLCDAKTRYLHFIGRHPQWLSRIKQQHIASYLGMSPETLCRIKDKL